MSDPRLRAAAEKLVNEAEFSWPHFEELKPDIIQIMSRDQYRSLRGAYETACRMNGLLPFQGAYRGSFFRSPADKFADAIVLRLETVGHLHK